MKRNSLVMAIALAAVLTSGAVFAQVETNSVDTKAAAILKNRQQKVDRCDVISKNVDKRVTNFEKQKTKHTAQYRKTQTRVTKLVDRLETEGYDVTTLRANLVIYDQKITKFETDYATYLSELRGTKEYTCGKSSGEFKAKLEIAREQLKVVHEDSVAIRTFWAKTLKPEVEALKAPADAIATPKVEGGTN